jgi:predicted enzyme related to lactoylglutathione lyase
MDQEAMKQHGAFSWNELVTTDVAGAKAFYGALLGWELRDEQTPDMTYTTIKAGDKPVGGLMAMPENAQNYPSMWGAYVTVDDVDKQIKHAEKLGGKIILPPKEIPNVGRFAVISDPQGAMLTLITYSDKCQ